MTIMASTMIMTAVMTVAPAMVVTTLAAPVSPFSALRYPVSVPTIMAVAGIVVFIVTMPPAFVVTISMPSELGMAISMIVTAPVVMGGVALYIMLSMSMLVLIGQRGTRRCTQYTAYNGTIMTVDLGTHHGTDCGTQDAANDIIIVTGKRCRGNHGAGQCTGDN